MSRRRMVSVAIVAATASMIGSAWAGAAGAPKTLSYLEVTTTFDGVGGYNPETTQAPPSVGQGFTFASTLYKWAGTKKGAPLGHDQVVCTVTTEDLSTGSVSLQCVATEFLPGGTIQLAGSSNFDNPVTNVAVVGGTGRYTGAQGTARIRSIGGENSSNSSYVIHITS